MEADVLDANLLAALSRTYGFRRWEFGNEAEFKHELFHQLARPLSDGSSLAIARGGQPTCRLHCEGKVENGNPQKADLLICNPERRKRFNYDVEFVFELKQELTRSEAIREVERFRKYRNAFHGYYLIAERPIQFDVGKISEGLPAIHILDRSAVEPSSEEISSAARECSFQAAIDIVRETIGDVLLRYGAGREQYHSFFWCNYEHEEWRRHSFPCEGDFNAHIYHELRDRLPPGVQIRSEVRPTSDRGRVDFVVISAAADWFIPIEVKMNWDQFKPKFKDGLPQTSEADTILRRFRALAAPHALSHPIVVVIQGSWQLPRNVRASARPVLERCDFPLELFEFDEDKGRITQTECGPRARQLRC